MTSKRLLIGILCVLVAGGALAQDQSMDATLSSLAADLAGQIKDHGNKKVTVLDFTDLQGNYSELGRYIAEQLTVDLVMSKHDFAVLDRANLKQILAEHKLTAKGLVDPENAKKLGQFAGVDALILGTFVPTKQNVQLTAKIITTDTAEIIGAAKAQFTSDDTVQKFLSNPTTTQNVDQASPAPSPSFKKPFGDLAAKIETLRLKPGDNYFGYATVTFIITNASQSDTYKVAVNPDLLRQFSLSNNRGDVFEVNKVSGIGLAFKSFMGYNGSFQDIPPQSSTTVVAESQVEWHGARPGDYRPYHLQTEVLFGTDDQGRIANVRTYNLVMDIR